MLYYNKNTRRSIPHMLYHKANNYTTSIAATYFLLLSHSKKQVSKQTCVYSLMLSSMSCCEESFAAKFTRKPTLTSVLRIADKLLLGRFFRVLKARQHHHINEYNVTASSNTRVTFSVLHGWGRGEV